jgi:two-component system sensor histidine kinase UhpB
MSFTYIYLCRTLQNAAMEAQYSFPAGLPSSSPNDQTPALVAALQQSQIDIEVERSALVSILHDNLGGLLVGAIMDMGWIANQPGLPNTVRKNLGRAQALMRAANDMTRELIENLRPSLLENVGLFTALRWHMKASCQAAAASYAESFPHSEQLMDTEIKIGVFRIFQEALKSALAKPAPTDLSLTVEVIGDTLHCHFFYRSTAQEHGEGSARSPDTSMHHRARRVGGTLQWSTSLAGHRHMHLQVPLSPPVCVGPKLRLPNLQ